MNNTTTPNGMKWEKCCWNVGRESATEMAASYSSHGYQARVVSHGQGYGWDCEILVPIPGYRDGTMSVITGAVK